MLAFASPPRPDESEVSVRCRYIGAQTRQTCENRDACVTAAPVSASWMRRSEFAERSRLIVG